MAPCPNKARSKDANTLLQDLAQAREDDATYYTELMLVLLRRCNDVEGCPDRPLGDLLRGMTHSSSRTVQIGIPRMTCCSKKHKPRFPRVKSASRHLGGLRCGRSIGATATLPTAAAALTGCPTTASSTLTKQMIAPPGAPPVAPGRCARGQPMIGKRRFLCDEVHFSTFCWERRCRQAGLWAALHHAGQDNAPKFSVSLPGARLDPNACREARAKVARTLRRYGFDRITLYIHTFGENPAAGATALWWVLRPFQPHLPGTKDGNMGLFAYQLEGHSSSGGLPQWRRMHLFQTSNVQALERTFAGGCPFPSGKHSEWDSTHPVVEP